MPVDPTYEYIDQAHPSTIDDNVLYSCHNRPPVKPYIQLFQDGWTEEGTRKMVPVEVSFKENVNCGHIGLSGLNRTNDIKCKDCRWKLV